MESGGEVSADTERSAQADFTSRPDSSAIVIEGSCGPERAKHISPTLGPARLSPSFSRNHPLTAADFGRLYYDGWGGRSQLCEKSRGVRSWLRLLSETEWCVRICCSDVTRLQHRGWVYGVSNSEAFRHYRDGGHERPCIREPAHTREDNN